MCCDAWTVRASRAMRGSASAYSLGLCVCCDVNGNVTRPGWGGRGSHNDVTIQLHLIFNLDQLPTVVYDYCRRANKMPNKLAGTPTYQIWRGMKRRCYRVTATDYAAYGGCGVVVCSGWKTSFTVFLEDMGERPGDGYSIDRKDGDGHYSCGRCSECVSNGWPSNCRWATHAEQRRNQKNVRMLTFRGETTCLKDMAEKYGMSKGVLHSRLASGWSLGDALLTPVRQWRENQQFYHVPEPERDAEWRRDAERRAARANGT